MDELVSVNEKSKQVCILFVDDDRLLFDTFDKELSLRGYRYETAISANIALELLRKDSIDIMVIDVVLPDMEGLELITKAKK